VAGVPGEAKSEFLSVDGVRLHYLDWGNGGAPPVVCVHGYASSAQASGVRTATSCRRLRRGGW